MNQDEHTGGSTSEPRRELPPLHTTTLDTAQVEQLLTDIECCTELLEILPKHGAQTMVLDNSRLTLSMAREMLSNRSVRGLQLRYRYEGAEWWDTLILSGENYRVVRIRHEFDSDNSA